MTVQQQREQKHQKTLKLVETAMLAAIVVLMSFTPIGYLKIGALSITFIMIPVVIGGITVGPAAGAVLGAIIFRLVYTVALRFDMPASMLKLVSSVIVIIAISGPYLKGQLPLLRRRMDARRGKEGGENA